MSSSVPTGACISGNQFCLYGTPSSDNKQVMFTIHAATQGWAGVALGDEMANGDFYIGWKNSSGGYTLSRRTPNGNSMPRYSSNNQIAQIIPLQVPSPSWAKLAFSFSRPIVADNTITDSSRFIYGMANNPPANPDDPASTFMAHSAYGNLPAANFLSSSGGSVSTGSGSSAIISSSLEVYEKVMTAHGILFFIAWVIAPFVGIFIARYLKAILGPLWYKLHMGILGGVTGGLSVIGFLLAILYHQGKHFDGSHQVIGLVIMISTALQIALGFIIDALYDPGRQNIPWWDNLHWYFGKALFLLAIINGYLGLREFAELGFTNSLVGLTAGYWVVVGLGFAAFIFGEFKFGQTHDAGGPETKSSEF